MPALDCLTSALLVTWEKWPQFAYVTVFSFLLHAPGHNSNQYTPLSFSKLVKFLLLYTSHLIFITYLHRLLLNSSVNHLRANIELSIVFYSTFLLNWWVYIKKNFSEFFELWPQRISSIILLVISESGLILTFFPTSAKTWLEKKDIKGNRGLGVRRGKTCLMWKRRERPF